MVSVNHSLGEGLRCLLRQVMAHATVDQSILVFTGEALGIGFGGRMGSTIGIAFQGDGRHADRRERRQFLFQSVVFGFARDQAQAPAIIED